MYIRRFFYVFLTSILSFASVVTAQAQGLSVDSFHELEEATAQLPGTAERDQNGKVAALIKIVTPEQGFTFEGGSMGIVAAKQKNGEIWLYLPGEAEKVTIKHNRFGVLRDYFFPVTPQSGHTYEMLLSIGTGRYVNIAANIANSDIYIDGAYVGKVPLRNIYLDYGRHTIKAVGDRHEGTLEALVRTSDEQSQTLTVEMEDMSSHFGDVHVTVANRAEIFYNGQKVGTGEWTTSLREGRHTIETYLPDCDTTATIFTVEPQKMNNIAAKIPEAHTGYLNIFVRTRNVDIETIGPRKVDLSNPVVPVGTYRLLFSRKGYDSQEHEYHVARNQMTTDTITLQRTEYIKKLSFYFGGGYMVTGMSGISGILGAVVYNHDLQLSYTFGLGKTGNKPWSEKDEYGFDNYVGMTNHQLTRLAVKYGYQINLLQQLGLTPQVGYAYHRLNSNIVEGDTKYGNGASASALTVGLKILAVPFQHFSVFVAPEYNVAISKDATYNEIATATGFSPSHFAATIGVLANF